MGAETDVSFPSFVGGSRTFNSTLTGQANYLEQVEFAGTVRGRIGFAPGHWLFYATGGLAWSYEQFSRTQLAGTPVGGTSAADTIENQFLVPRVGATIGGGVEIGLNSHWTAQLQYLLTDYPNRGVTFPRAGERFNADLLLNEIRFGLNYRLGSNAIDWGAFINGPDALDLGWFAIHGQTTFVSQYAAPFHAPYHGRKPPQRAG